MKTLFLQGLACLTILCSCDRPGSVSHQSSLRTVDIKWIGPTDGGEIRYLFCHPHKLDETARLYVNQLVIPASEMEELHRSILNNKTGEEEKAALNPDGGIHVISPEWGLIAEFHSEGRSVYALVNSSMMELICRVISNSSLEQADKRANSFRIRWEAWQKMRNQP